MAWLWGRVIGYSGGVIPSASYSDIETLKMKPTFIRSVLRLMFLKNAA